MLNLQVEAPFKVSDDLNQLIEDKVTGLTKFFERITTAQVYLKNVENRHQHADPRGKVVEIRCEIPNHSLFAESSAESFEKALAEATEKMKRQLRDKKQQMTDYQNR